MTEDSPASGGGDRKADDKKEEPKQPRRLRWPIVVGGLIVVAFVALVLVVIFQPHPDVWTDDATVTVHYATVAPRVSGQIVSVQVNDNQPVRAGQVLATIDPRDLRAAVDIANGMLEQDQAQFDNASANLAQQPPVIDQQHAAVASAEARLAFARADARRFSNLAASGAGTGQQRQQAASQLRQEMASLDSARSALETQQRRVAVLTSQRSAADAAIRTDQARLAQARLNLSYTTITAPIDGVVGNRSVQVGDYVAPGTALLTVVPLDSAYIESNYREEALRHMRPGQHVRIHVDAYAIDLDGIVQSVPPASGAEFAPIAPSNATGNFTKIVQRLPVKIVVAPGQPLARLLRVGFSVETTVHTGLADVVGAQQASSVPVLGN